MTKETSRTCSICSQTKRSEDFYKGKLSCKECHSAYYKAYYGKNKDKKKQKTELKIQENRKKLKELFGGKWVCAHCGFTHPTTAPFDFHHVDPSEKEHTPSQIIHYNWERVEREYSKCILLCANCHRIEHERLRDENSDS